MVDFYTFKQSRLFPVNPTIQTSMGVVLSHVHVSCSARYRVSSHVPGHAQILRPRCACVKFKFFVKCFVVHY